MKKEYYTYIYETTRKINRRKKETPDNLEKVWFGNDFKYKSLEEVKYWIQQEGHEVYKIYKTETELVEESL